MTFEKSVIRQVCANYREKNCYVIEMKRPAVIVFEPAMTFSFCFGNIQLRHLRQYDAICLI